MGAYTLLQDLTVTTNSTSVVLNDFGTITKDDFIKVVVTHVNSTSSSVATRLEVTGTVNTNYHIQLLTGNGTTVSAARINDSQIISTPPNGTSTSIGYLKLSENNRLNAFINNNLNNASDLWLRFFYLTSSGATFANGITSLTFIAGVTNAIGTGSRIQIYKLAAQKVRDIIVETNSTQVDIPTTGIFDPAIDKDSEYLLTWTVDSTTNSGTAYHLTPNDLTTLSGYQRQEVFGNGSVAGAGRANNARFAETSNDRRISTGYAHIKLSNIGAYTFQGYDLLGSGSTVLILSNGFVSSTAENITSITKLNIISSVSNNIKAGSRFTLYKLYE